LWQNGQFSYYPARIGAKIVSAYVEKQRRLANNLVTPAKPPAPAEMSAIWTVPNAGASSGKSGKSAPDRLQAGRFLIDHGEIVGQAGQAKAGQAQSSQSSSRPVGIGDLKGHGFSRADVQPNGGPALAAAGVRRNEKNMPQGLKPTSSLGQASGTAKAVPFQSEDSKHQGEDPKQRRYVLDSRPAIADSGKGR
jgi:hypothetical protein